MRQAETIFVAAAVHTGDSCAEDEEIPVPPVRFELVPAAILQVNFLVVIPFVGVLEPLCQGASPTSAGFGAESADFGFSAGITSLFSITA